MGPRKGDGAVCGTAGLTAAAMRALAANPWLPLASGTVAPDIGYALWYAILRRLTGIRTSIDRKLPRWLDGMQKQQVIASPLRR